MQRRLAEWKRGGAEFSVILLNVRDLRPCVTGGQRGTQPPPPSVCLRSTRAALREGDLLAEFKPGTLSVLLPRLGHDGAVALGQELRRAVEAGISRSEGRPTDVVTSVGLAEASPGDDMVRLLMRAEEALEAAIRSNGGGFWFHNSQWTEPVLAAAEAPSA